MDSLTQIVLGAAVGEVVLGKKIGNRAMLWGAVAGTIPDLDVYQSLFFDALRSNELHRGFSHSILFSILIAPLLAWLVQSKEKLTLAFLVTIILAYPIVSTGNWYIGGTLGVVIFLLNWLILTRDYTKYPQVRKKDWTRLFFWSLITHPFLDCHTTWGTQLLWPLPYKLAWNNIFVIDPLYTVPFLVFVLVGVFYGRQHKNRLKMVSIGLVLSSLYMIWSLGAKWYTFNIFQNNLKEQGVAYNRLMTVPTPLNTFLWSATADADSLYYTGLYSIFDKDKTVDFTSVKTNHSLLNSVQDEETLHRMQFLSKNWYVVSEDYAGVKMFNDARFGPFYTSDGDPRYGFGYRLNETNGKIEVTQPEPETEEMGEAMNVLWNRIWGK